MKPQNGRNMAELRVEGKTKVVMSDNGDINLVSIITKDALTGNDGELQQSLPVATEKTEQTCNVFRLLENNGIPTAYVNQSSEISFVAHRCKMLPLECVTRRQPYGSYLKRHPEKTFAEIFNPPLVEFFHKFTVILPEKRMISEDSAREQFLNEETGWRDGVYTDPLIRFTREDQWSLYNPKAPSDESEEPLMRMPAPLSSSEISEIRETLVRPTFEVLEQAWKEQEVTLVDMKIEVGRRQSDNKIVVADVIDNDSWRVWPKGNPRDQLDKQSFREGEDNYNVINKYRIVTECTRKFVRQK